LSADPSSWVYVALEGERVVGLAAVHVMPSLERRTPLRGSSRASTNRRNKFTHPRHPRATRARDRVPFATGSVPIHPLLPGTCLQMTKEELEGYLADGLSLEQIGKRVGKHASTVSYHLAKHGLLPLGHPRHTPNQKVNSDELREMMGGGTTIREAAKRFGVGYSTIRYWLKRLGIETAHASRLREARDAVEAGKTRVVLTCPEHGEVPFFRRPDGNYRCSKCRAASVTAWRRRVKLRLIKRAGGCCVICGYDRHPAALHFHHVDPDTKSFILSRHGVTRSYREAAAEADKCVLLCANCHAEVEAGATNLPPKARPLELAQRQAS
jgi:transposase